MIENDKLQMFEDQAIRTAWDEEKEEWYFSVVDVVGVLTEQPDARHAAKYWSVLKTRLKSEGCELVTNCPQLKVRARDEKPAVSQSFSSYFDLPVVLCLAARRRGT